MNIKIDKEKLAKFAKTHGVRFLVLHGSYAQGTANAESDCDIAVYFKVSKSDFQDFSEYASFTRDLEKLLPFKGASTDLVVLNQANILLRYEITSKGRLLYGDQSVYAQYKAFAYREYLDSGSLFKLEDKLIKKRQKFLKQAIA